MFAFSCSWKGLITGRKLNLWARLIGFPYCYCLFFNNNGVTFHMSQRMFCTHTDDTKSRCALLSLMHTLYLPVDAHLVFFFHPLCVCPFLCCWRDVHVHTVARLVCYYIFLFIYIASAKCVSLYISRTQMWSGGLWEMMCLFCSAKFRFISR